VRRPGGSARVCPYPRQAKCLELRVPCGPTRHEHADHRGRARARAAHQGEYGTRRHWRPVPPPPRCARSSLRRLETLGALTVSCWAAMADVEPDNPSQAGVPSTKGPTREYPSVGITVIWDATLCIHTGRCLRGLPAVFNLDQRPWVDVAAAPPDEIAAVIRRCPTDALRYRPGPGLAEERPDSPTTIEPRPNGPLFVSRTDQYRQPARRGARRGNPRCPLPMWRQ
jgi:uncharacterized Fe-S cluster protein YjdI